MVNPGFETYNPATGAFAGWSSPPYVYFNDANFYPPHSGAAAATTGIVGQTAPLSQNISLRAGKYQLTFYADARGNGNGTILQASLGGKQLLNQAGATNQYEFYSFNYTQTRRGVVSLEFDTRNDPDYTSIDDVSLIFLQPLRRPVDFRQYATTRNERAVANVLYAATKQVISQRGPLYHALRKATKSAATTVLNGLSGEGITAAQNVANRSSQLFTSSIFDQTTFYGNGSTANSITLMESAPGMVALAARQGLPIRELADLPSSRVTPVFVAPTRTWRAWATGFGGTEDIHGNAAIGSAAQSNDIYGGALGVDYQLMPNFLVGVAVGGSNGDFTVAQRGTTGATTGGHVALYDLAAFGSYYSAASIAFSDFDNKTNRAIGGFGGLSAETLRGHFNSDEFRGRFEVGRHFAGLTGFGTITPFVAIEAASLRSSGFGETAVNGTNLLGLNVNGQSASDVPGFVGLRFQNVMRLGGFTFLPTLQVAYEHEFEPYRQETAALINLPGSTFLVDGARPARNAAQVKAGGEMKIGPSSALFVNFDGEFSGVEQAYAGKGGFRYVW